MGHLGAGWDLTHSPSFQERDLALPDSLALQPQAAPGFPSLGSPCLEWGPGGTVPSAGLCSSLRFPESHPPPRAILPRLTSSPARAPGEGQELLQQGRKKLLAPLGEAGTVPAPCPCRGNPQSSSGGKEGEASTCIPPAPTHLEEPPGMGSGVRAHGEGPSCQSDQLGTSGGW